jgi:hypothetical protein
MTAEQDARPPTTHLLRRWDGRQLLSLVNVGNANLDLLQIVEHVKLREANADREEVRGLVCKKSSQQRKWASRTGSAP